MSHQFWILLLCLAAVSCQKFETQFSGLASQCGMQAEGHTVVQIQDPEGLKLSIEGGNVQAHWLPRDEVRASQTLSLNQAGCVRLPPEAGVLEVRARLPAGAVRRAYERVRSVPYEKLKLVATPGLSIQARCLEGTTYARDQLFFPFTSNRSGDFASVRMALVARPSSGGTAFMVWQKPFHESQFEFPQHLDVSALEEGQYEMFLQWQELSAQEPALSSSCTVSIRRQVPVLTGFPLAPRPRVRTLAQGTILPWSSRNAEDTLGLCRKKLTNEIEELPDSHCNRPDQYQPAQLIVADQPGLWEYCLVAEDKAGNRSPPYCEQLLISPSGPEIQVAWLHPDLKGPLPLLKRPYAHIQARIQLKHPLLTEEQLQKNLQCKVNIAISAEIHATGGKVRCMNGACAGEDLAEFRSCPSDLTLDLTDLWTQPLQRRARLQLMVRAEDGAGQTAAAQADAWIHELAWYAEPMSNGRSGLPEGEEPVRIRLDRTGRTWLLAKAPGETAHIYLRASTEWQRTFEFPSPSDKFGSQDLFQDGEGTLYAGGDNGDEKLTIYKLNENDQWDALPVPDLNNAKACDRFVGAKQGFACVTVSHVLRWRPSGWSFIERPKNGDEPLCAELNDILLVDGERIWSTCKGLLYLYEGGLWQRKPTPEIDVVESMQMDGLGRIWVQTLNPYYKNNGLGYFDRTGDWHPTGANAGLPDSILGFNMLTFGTDQSLYYGPYVWDETTFRWGFISVGSRPAFDPSAESIGGLGNQAWIVRDTQQTFVEMGRADPIVWHLPSEGMEYKGSQVSFRDVQDHLWWIMRDLKTQKQTLYRLRDSLFVPWDEGLTGVDIGHEHDIKMDASGKLWLLKLGFLYRYEQGLWRVQAKFSAPIPNTLMPTPSGRLFLGAPGSIYEWTQQGAQLIYSVPGNQLYFSNLAEDNQGAVWFRMTSAVDGTLYRFSDGKFETFTMESNDPDASFLSSRIFIDRGRLSIINGGSIWGFDSTSKRFVTVDPSELSLPPGQVYVVHEISLQDTLIEAIEPGVGAVALVQISRENVPSKAMPLPPGLRFGQAFKKDKEGHLWAADNDDHVYRFTANQAWELRLDLREVHERLSLTGGFITGMTPASEGGLLVQIYEGPLLRLIP
ncbi:MAG TPA: hypothetical protein VE954_06080 [Oligoflexus sp.]|uniref:hypothetical protein n=1 Tax=Oligoflexus sp. TaxID=1971216 RepID=UPI002D25349F|nr:hypothetical protein [Oligoflexus sp.]HYX32662.1 hypothetical protein [Oligoflexus sp.]